MTRPERDDQPTQPTQKTQPKKGKPAEIPVPTREEWLRNLKKVAPPPESAPRDDGDASN